MIEIIEKRKCCGCGSCAASCPVSCIEMVADEQGFFYPKVDKNKCIQCGKCERSCPIIHVKKPEVSVEGYIAMNRELEVRKNSSSGGIFSVLAQFILDQNGSVFGAAFDEDFTVHHIEICSKEELYKLRRSKYVQSRMEDCYSIAKKRLEQGKKVLFSGTACQIAGLKQFLSKEYENLYTVDVLCHGVPSVEVWKRYLNEQKKQYGSEIKNVVLRSKNSGWKSYSVHLDFENGEVYERRYQKDAFMMLFLKDICLRESCYDCKFKELERLSDLTIGDAWGVDDYMPEMDDDQGTSLILVRGEKGETLMQEVSKQCKLVSQEPNKILPEWNNARISVKPHPKKAVFWKKFHAGKSTQNLVKIVQDSIFKRGYYKCRNIMKKFFN